MYISELKLKLAEIEKEAEKQKRNAIQEYCLSNNLVKVGDVVTDHYHSIKVERIGFHYGYYDDYCCIYHGVELRKDGKPKRRNASTAAHQSDVKLINGVPIAMVKISEIANAGEAQ